MGTEQGKRGKQFYLVHLLLECQIYSTAELAYFLHRPPCKTTSCSNSVRAPLIKNQWGYPSPGRSMTKWGSSVAALWIVERAGTHKGRATKARPIFLINSRLMF
ncbi:hypothetical protein ECG_06297 [Echinococcus granulosus]|nr:hypothetical protein ECG_06297 [Echinococcus granulosus]